MLHCHYDWHFLGGKFQNLQLFCHFLLHKTFTSGYLRVSFQIVFKMNFSADEYCNIMY
jgi:hypothetical protein